MLGSILFVWFPICCGLFFFFFFSSRRRHTRSLRDWSSDVCSSDLLKKRNQSGALASGRWANDNYDPTLSWSDVTWLRKLWPGKLVLKGVLDADDAKRAADLGADAIVVSNHGGRQLDSAPSTIAALPRIADAAGDRIEILFDSGIRSGQDVLKALALGARGCLTGRAQLYGLAAMGGAGVAKALSLIESELKVSMSLTGVRDVAQVSRDILFDDYSRRN